jgi:glycosyltransferase involved in cell wall biosynthesis
VSASVDDVSARRPDQPLRLGFLVSHPIQYHAPVFRALAKRPDVDLTVHFCHDHGVRPSYDPGFGKTIQFDTPLLDGYRYRFLRNIAPRPSLAPVGQLNPGVVKVLLGGQFDALVVHGYSSLTTMISLLTPRNRTRLLLRGDSTGIVKRSVLKRFVKQTILSRLFGRVDGFLCIGVLNAAYYKSFGVSESRLSFAPLAIDNDFFTRGSDLARRDVPAARCALGLPTEGPLLLCVGKLIAIKRPLDVVRGFARINHDPLPVLAFVGDGPMRGEVEGEIRRLGLASRAKVLGFRNQSDLPGIYGAADCLVLASDGEPWGLVVNEAMASGVVPLLSDRVGAGPDLCPDPDCLFPTGDIERMAEAATRLLADPGRLQYLKLQSLNRIRGYDIQASADGIVRGVRKACHRG